MIRFIFILCSLILLGCSSSENETEPHRLNSLNEFELKGKVKYCVVKKYTTEYSLKKRDIDTTFSSIRKYHFNTTGLLVKKELWDNDTTRYFIINFQYDSNGYIK